MFLQKENNLNKQSLDMIYKYFPSIKYAMLEKMEWILFFENSFRSMNEIFEELDVDIVKIPNKRKDLNFISMNSIQN